MMNLLLIAYACEPNRGSEPGAGWNWSLNLSKIGHDVTVLTNSRGKYGIEEYLSFNPTENLHVVYIDLPKWLDKLCRGQIGVYARYYLWQLIVFTFAERIKSKFDLVHHITWSGLSTGSIFWKLGLPFVFGPSGGGQVAPAEFSDYFREDWKREQFRSFIVKYIQYSPFIRTFVKKTDLYLATNKDTLKKVLQCGSHKVTEFFDIGLQSDYYPQSFPIRASANVLRVLWVARLYSIKGLLLALDALSLCDFPVKLSIYGDGPLGQYVHKWINDRQLTDKVEWLGQQSWWELRNAYQTHDVFLFTSLRDSTGLQILEAMANGSPVIVLDHQGAREIVPDDGGIKIPVTTPKEVAAKIAESLKWYWVNGDKRVEMGNRAFEYAKQYSWDKVVARMVEIYGTVL